jgi:UPF0716 protein FxsA
VPLLALMFFVLPLAELFVIVKSSQAIGIGNTIGLLIVVSVVGAYLVKREGRRVWGRFNQQIASGVVPSREIADGVCLLLAGALLLTPGFLTDIVGVLLLLPPSRALIRPLLVKRFTGKARVITATHGGRIFDTTVHDEPPSPDPRRGQLGG